MSNDKGFFETPEFRYLFKRYEQTKAQGLSSYFETHELSDILSYYLYNDKPSEVEEVYTLAKRLHPDNPEVAKMEIRILLTYGKAKEALALFDNIQYDEDDDTMLLKAEVLLTLKDYKASRKIARNILRKNTITDDISYDALEILLDCGFAQEVLDIVTEGLHQYPHTVMLMEVKAESLIELQKTDEATEIYNTLLDDNPYSTFYWEQLGHIYYMTERYGKALECFEYELTIDGSIEYATMMQGYCHYHLRNYTKAIEIFNTLSTKYKQSIMPRFYIALSLAQEGKAEEAIEKFMAIYIEQRESTDTTGAMFSMINTALLWQKLGNEEKSKECMAHAICHLADNEGLKQFLLDATPYHELRDKENMTFADMNTIEIREWKQYELLQSLGTQLLKKGDTALAFYPLFAAHAIAPDTADIDACLAYIIHKNGGDKKEISELVTNAINGRSNKLFELFDIPYNSNLLPHDFINIIYK
ncbi:MAG: tetratricopeptide repeat protein [Bacteroidaceae bacterium]|nr:tetratricopeptide repeat protein [Bacteroidaceae bacterium]